MDKIKLVLTEFWEDTKVMALSNPKKVAVLIVVSFVLGYLIG